MENNSNTVTKTALSILQILLNAVCGKWYRSDIAVDDVRFNDGKCNPATTEATTTVPSISSTTVANDLGVLLVEYMNGHTRIYLI